MGGLPEDVLVFVKHSFAQKDHAAAHQLLETPAVATPRVMRAVLYLADGSLGRLRQHVIECQSDVRSILTSAEYVIAAHGKPVRVRDMSLPFGDQGNPAAGDTRSDIPAVGSPVVSARPKPAAAKKRANHHSYLVHRSFKLGEVTYMIASAQPRRSQVSCYRKSGTVVRLVNLPLMFVLEQLAERIELETSVP